jgi:hypothetical protein
MNAEPQYDVAISFVAADEPLAVQLRDSLQPPLRVFVYSKHQEQLAGRDGTEVFREVFRNQSKLVVVLHRPPWGDTPWTRVEEQAIKELCFEEGWEHLVFTKLDQSSVPKWVPKPHLYLDLTTFTLAELVGAIKARLVELGVELLQPTAAERALAQARRRKFDEETRDLLSRDPGVFVAQLAELEQAIKAIAADISATAGYEMETGIGAVIRGFVIHAQGQTLQLAARELYANTARDAYVQIAEYDRTMHVYSPAYHYFYTEDQLQPARTRKMFVRRLESIGWCWELDGRVHPTAAAAEAIANLLLDRIDSQGRN